MTFSVVLTWSNLAAVFDGRTVFRGFTGSLSRGERLRIAGSSGCGKTTFLNMVLGFVRPVEGDIHLSDDIRSLAAAVPQEPPLGVVGTVRDWLDVVFSYQRNRASRPTGQAVLSLLDGLQLSKDILESSVSSVSGGEKQRVALAAALLLPRELLILDEPFSALDAEAASCVASVIRASGRTVLYASHVDPVSGFATREVSL